ncbi:hypothetical protein C1H76_1283 [Elsinoe australis]|uniref:Uncharacterized protein n=1 Tax=Elsinoe australis TaxID=40998 RepID=A0A4U7B935_9PEZI|nr:hypothetical protein C1H76_1283 [Elsinoe australis]
MSRPSTPYAPLKDFKLIRNTNLNAPTVNSYFVYFILLGQASGNPLILPCPAMIPVSGTEANRELAGSCRGLTFTINLGDGTVMVRMQQNSGQLIALKATLPRTSLSFSNGIISLPEVPLQPSTGTPALTDASTAPSTPRSDGRPAPPGPPQPGPAPPGGTTRQPNQAGIPNGMAGLMDPPQ